VAVVAVLLALGQAAQAAPGGGSLDRARVERRRAQAAVAALEDRVAGLRSRLDRQQQQLEAATAILLEEERRLRDTSLRLDVAQDTFTRRVRAAFELGSVPELGLYFSAQTPEQLASVHEFTQSVLSADLQAVTEVALARASLAAGRTDLTARRRALERAQGGVERLLARISEQLSSARETARQAGLRVADIERAQRAVEAARQREEARKARLAQQDSADGQIDDAGSGGGAPAPGGGSPAPGGVDQSHLLSLLGPTGGRTCDTPSGLRETGQSISGDATWYGPGFAGRRTASGAIFDPRLFTAAHRTLPFGVFLKVHAHGRCAIVLVNDRGPYIYSRVVDLSQAAGTYLGVGVTPITAEILVPR
jgi:rare lipoprotein A